MLVTKAKRAGARFANSQNGRNVTDMKETTKMSRAVSQLEHIYNALNTDFFDGLLPVPIITVQSKPGTYGHCTTAKV